MRFCLRKIQKAPVGFNAPTESDAKKYGVKVGTDVQQFQYAVSYIKTATYPMRFYGSLKKLQSKMGRETLKITFFGDSITAGANATGAYSQPNQPGYVDLVMASLSAKNPQKWLYRNNSVGGVELEKCCFSL
jgi:hypothetical protein